MKIGITTYFNIKNYGSVLQAFAMRKILSDNGCEAEFLNVLETAPVDKIFHKAHVAAVTMIKCLLFKQARNTQKEIFRLKKETTSAVSPETSEAFEIFQKENLPSISIGRRLLKKKAYTEEYVSFICGSDQIWSPLSPHLSGYKFLDFAPKSKRIAYAPSFGVSQIPTYNQRFVKEHIKQIENISIREKEGANIIKELTGLNAPVVLDPTMLLSGEDWRELYIKNTDVPQNSRYVLCYFFDEPCEETVEAISAFADENGLKIIVLFSSNKQFLAKGAVCVSAGPWEFLSLIDNAQYVFTNSFHGCVFSALFQKQFIAFGRKHSDTVKQTSRINSLLELINAEDSFCDETNTDFCFPNVNLFSEPISNARHTSLKYLKDSLERSKLQ